MYKSNAAKLLSVLFFLTTFFGCTKGGLYRYEIEKITTGTEDEKMGLLTIDNNADSLFLRKVARKVEQKNILSATMQRLKRRMNATVNDSLNSGVGIAAPQVGISLRMILVQRLDKANKPFEVYYNPKIEEFGDSINSGIEGCLSVPGLKGKVERSQNIEISYLDSNGIKCNEVINGFTAVIFQHEIDHLHGCLYFDHIFDGFNSLISDVNSK